MASIFNKIAHTWDDFKNNDAKPNKESEDSEEENQKKDEIPKKPRIDYKMNLPQRGEVESVKLLNDPKHLYQFLSSKEGPFFANDNFERRFLYELPKLLWQTERLEDLGDFVLLFPNPDKNNSDGKSGISLKEAEDYFKLIFETSYSFPYKHKFMTALKAGYSQAFLDLSIGTKDLITNLNIFEHKGNHSKSEHRRHFNPPQVYANIFPIKRKNGDGFTTLEEVQKLLEDIILSEKKRDNAIDAIKSIEAKEANEDIKAIKAIKSKEVNEANEAIQALKPKLDEVYKILEKQKEHEIKKLFGGGQFIKPKKFNEISRNIKSDSVDKPATGKNENSERQKNKEKQLEEKYRYNWPRSHNKREEGTQDYCTLLRKTVAAVLANQGFLMREVFLDNGNLIGMVLTISDNAVRETLREIGMKRIVEFGMIDLMSMEPIDSKYRPLRHNEYLHDDNLWSKTYTPNLGEIEITNINTMRAQILELLKSDCNMKNIIRLARSKWLDPEETTIYSPDMVPLSVWRSYHLFLVNLAIRLREIKSNKNKLSLCSGVFCESQRRRGQLEWAQDAKFTSKLDIDKFTTREIVKAFEASLVVVEETCEGQSREVLAGGCAISKLSTLWTELEMTRKQYFREYQPDNPRMRRINRMLYGTLWKEYIHISNPENKSFTNLLEECPGRLTLCEFSKIERLKACYHKVGDVH